ncbi:MAG: pentapeptide repeat-containing protein [Geminicoccaceae bacterium]
MDLTTEQPDKTLNWRAASFPFAQGVLFALKCDFIADAMGAFKDAHETLTREYLTTGQLGHQLWCETFSLALVEGLKKSRVTVLQNDAELKNAITDYLATSFEAGATFGEGALLQPASFTGYQPIRTSFPQFLQRIDPTIRDSYDFEAAQNYLDAAINQALIRVWSSHSDRYSPIADLYREPFASAARRENAWMRHYGWIRDKFENAPVFSPDMSIKVKLAQVYIRLRCYSHELRPIEKEEERDDASREQETKFRRVAHLNWLHDEVECWLDNDHLNQPIRVVAGGPGSGKSSFARALACEQIPRNRYRVIFVELQHMHLSGDLFEDLNRHLTRNPKAGFFENPLDWRYDDSKPYLLIFDGLDELARADDKATDLTKRFIYNLKRMLHLTDGTGQHIKALVLGRSTAAEEGRKDAELEATCLLHVLPLRPPIRHDLDLERRHQDGQNDHDLAKTAEDVEDPRGLLTADDVDLRPTYWRDWCRWSGEQAEPQPDGLTHNDLAELNAEPLLLHLLIISGYMTPEKWPAAADNRNVVYEGIFKQVFCRDKAANKWSTARIDEDDFFALMECLGLASWAGGGRTGSDEDFKRLRKRHASRQQERKFAKLNNTDLKGVAIQFYTRQELDADTGFEFIHKSFGEYLIGRALLAAARKIEEQNNATEEDAAKAWLEITGAAEITSEILRFLRDEARRLTLDKAQALKDELQELMNWTLKSGMPAQGTGTFREMETRQRFAEGALLAVLNATARRIAPNDKEAARIQLAWQDTTTFRFMLERLQLTGLTNSPLLGCLSFLNCEPLRADNGQLFSHNLQVLWLSRADLDGASLDGANLSRANLTWASLTGASLSRADLDGAILSWANLDGASLTGASLIGADLSWAILSRADLDGANLTGAKLIGANLIGANLTGANLSRANLSRADLDGANLSRAILDGANLTGANLNQEQINAAHGSKITKLLKGLE